MNKEERVIKYYCLCNKLKNVIRTGWIDWNVKKERLESVAEHIYGVQMLAIAIYSEYKYDIDIKKVLYMLAVHELEEIIIGDLTIFQITKEEKHKKGIEAVKQVLGDLLVKEEILNLVIEFDEEETKEALFAHYCDKLECDIQCKLYDLEGCVSLDDQENNKTFDEKVSKLLQEEKTWSNMWLRYSSDRYNYDDNFKNISDFVKNNDINNL